MKREESRPRADSRNLKISQYLSKICQYLEDIAVSYKISQYLCISGEALSLDAKISQYLTKISQYLTKISQYLTKILRVSLEDIAVS